MKSFKSFFASCLLVAILAVAGFAQSSPTLSAVTVVSQLPTTCTAATGTTAAQQTILQGQSGAYTGQGSGLYVCVEANVWQLFGQGANTLELQGGDYSNATATAGTITAGGTTLSFPLNPNGTYKFSCTLFYTNTGTNAVTFTMITPTSPTNVVAYATNIYAAAGTQTFAPLTSSPLSIATTGATTGTVYKEDIAGTIENGANAGVLAFQASAATGTTAVKRGSYCSIN